MKKQTAVEFLMEELRKHGRLLPDGLVAKTKEIEKIQIKEAYMSGTSQFANDARIDYPKTSEEYYNQTFKK